MRRTKSILLELREMKMNHFVGMYYERLLFSDSFSDIRWKVFLTEMHDSLRNRFKRTELDGYKVWERELKKDEIKEVLNSGFYQRTQKDEHGDIYEQCKFESKMNF